jgi:hypothetical protein
LHHGFDLVSRTVTRWFGNAIIGIVILIGTLPIGRSGRALYLYAESGTQQARICLPQSAASYL